MSDIRNPAFQAALLQLARAMGYEKVGLASVHVNPSSGYHDHVVISFDAQTVAVIPPYIPKPSEFGPEKDAGRS